MLRLTDALVIKEEDRKIEGQKDKAFIFMSLNLSAVSVREPAVGCRFSLSGDVGSPGDDSLCNDDTISPS